MRFVLVCAVLCLVSFHANSADTAGVLDRVSLSGMSGAASVEDGEAVIPHDELAAPVYSRQELCDAVVAAAEAHELPIGFLARLIWQESGFDTVAVSRAGAQGIAQFMPEVAAEMGVDPFDPTEALPASARFLRDLYRQFGNAGLAAAAYNAGAGRVRNWLSRRTRLPQETRNYVQIITGRQPEQWIGTRQKFSDYKFPLGTQCQQAAANVVAAQASRWNHRASRPRVIRVQVESIASPDATVSR